MTWIPLTQEDWECWHWPRVSWNDLPRLALMDAYEAADARDAFIMSVLVRYAARYDFSYPGCVKYGAHLAMRVREIGGGDMGETFTCVLEGLR